MSDFDWTDHGTAEDHADRVEGVGKALGKDGRYVDATDMHVAANCIRCLSAKAEVLEKENDAAEKEIEALREACATEIKWLLRVIEQSQPVPDAMKDPKNEDAEWARGYKTGWNSCRAAMLAAAPKPGADDE